MVTLLQGLQRKTIPYFWARDGARHLERNIEVAALEGEVEARVLVLDEMKRNLQPHTRQDGLPFAHRRGSTHLREALLLQVRDDALADEVARLDDLQDLVVVVAHERKLEAVLGRIDRDGARARVAVEAVDRLAFDARKVHGLVERTNDAVVAVRQRVLDVVQRRVDEDAAVVPRARLDANRLVDDAALRQGLVRERDSCRNPLNEVPFLN